MPLRRAAAFVLAAVVLAAVSWPGPTARVTRLRERAAQLDLTPQERLWESVGWVQDLTRARALSHSTGKPLFLWTLGGNLGGRC